MAYEVTATRRRPQKFEDLIGQEFVAETFRNSIKAQKIAHAYLFTGPRGCGKTSTARILAKALNCAEGPTAVPCGHCQQCLEITKGSCTDVIEIDGASNTSVNDVRQIKDEILFPPQSCRYKIYIIDEVHMLSTPAFNALLKTIEEPPPSVIFIFATTELQKVPATIKSRCQQFNFRLIPIEQVKEQLALAAAEINVKAEDEALYWIARESTGSMRDAYTLFDQVAAFSGNEITYDKIRDKLGLVGVDRLNAIFEDCASMQCPQALEKLDSFLQSGISIEQLISNSTDYLRSLLLIKNGIVRESLLGQSAERYSQKVLSAWNPVQIERALSIFLQLFRDIRYSLSPRYELELAFSRLSWLSKYVSPAEVKVAIDKAKALLDGNSPAVSANPPASSVPPANPASSGPAFQSQPSISADFAAKMAAARANLQSSSVQTTAAEQDFQTAQPAPEGELPPIENEIPPEQSVPPDFNSGEFQSFSNGGAEPPYQAAAQTSQTEIDVNDGDQIKTAVLRELEVSNAILASSVAQTGPWNLNGKAISTQVNSAFIQKQLLSQIKVLSELVSRIRSIPTFINISVRQQQTVDLSANAPDSVKVLVSTFRGQIISRAENSTRENQNNNENANQSDNSEEAENQAAANIPAEEEDESI